MCDRTELVPIPAFLFGDIYDFDAEHNEYGINEKGERCLRLDACIVPAVKVLWENGFRTKGCCCGHGSGEGVISLITLPTEEGMRDARGRIRSDPETTLRPIFHERPTPEDPGGDG